MTERALTLGTTAPARRGPRGPMTRLALALTLATTAAALVAVAPVPGAAAAAPGPRVRVLVAFRSGAAVERTVRADAATVRVGHRRCAVAAGTPLAALLRAGVGRVALYDYGACSRRPADSESLYVTAVRREVAGGPDGWVYKVGVRSPQVPAALPSTRLRSGARITWLFCRHRGRSCQRTLAVAPRALGGGRFEVTVRGYDDQGRARPIAGAFVHAETASSSTSVSTDASGRATLALAPGRVRLYADAPGLVRSFTEAVDVR